MLTYRNTKTGVLVRVRSEIQGDWELVPDSPATVSKAQTEPKKRTRTKKQK